MVAFVATTDNFKDVAKSQAITIAANGDALAQNDQRLQEKTSHMQQEKAAIEQEKREIEAERNRLAVEKRTVETERDDYKIKYTTMSGVMTGLQTTIDNVTETLKLTQDELTKALANQTKLRAQLNTVEADQAEKIVHIEKLKAQVKNLIEAKSFLDDQLAQLSGGKTVTARQPVTQTIGYVKPASTAPTNVALKGVISEISPKLDLVAISLGSADGVTKKSIFHVTRGDEFICNIKITHVDTSMSAGIIELQKEQPKVGDTVSNRL